MFKKRKKKKERVSCPRGSQNHSFIHLFFQPAHRKQLSSGPLMLPVIELFISPSRSPIPSPRPAISSCLRPPALPPPSPSSAEGLTLVPLENKSDRKRDFPQAPASHVPTFQHMSPRPLPPPLPPLPARTVSESKATPLCVPDPTHSGSLEHIVQRFSVLSSVANFRSLLDHCHQHTNRLLFLPS